MKAIERLRGMVRYCPPGASLTVSVATLAELLDEIQKADAGAPEGKAPPVEADLTVREIASALNRKPSTIRNLLASGEIPGGYMFRDREWRLSKADLQRYLEEERASGQRSRAPAKPSRSRPRRPAELGEWRNVK